MSTSTKFAIEHRLIDQLVGGQNARTLFEPNGVFDKFLIKVCWVFVNDLMPSTYFSGDHQRPAAVQRLAAGDDLLGIQPY